jgi:hypothetical protein
MIKMWKKTQYVKYLQNVGLAHHIMYRQNKWKSSRHATPLHSTPHEASHAE